MNSPPIAGSCHDDVLKSRSYKSVATTIAIRKLVPCNFLMAVSYFPRPTSTIILNAVTSFRRSVRSRRVHYRALASAIQRRNSLSTKATSTNVRSSPSMSRITVTVSWYLLRVRRTRQLVCSRLKRGRLLRWNQGRPSSIKQHSSTESSWATLTFCGALKRRQNGSLGATRSSTRSSHSRQSRTSSFSFAITASISRACKGPLPTTLI